MPAITAFLHTENDALRLGRCLETLYPCDDILVVDHDSRDGTAHLAREYGAQVVPAGLGVAACDYFRLAGSSWVFCFDPRESLTESLAATLYEWKLTNTGDSSAPAFAVFMREETAEGWIEIPAAQTRLVRADWNRWQGNFPMNEHTAQTLEGNLLRFAFP